MEYEKIKAKKGRRYSHTAICSAIKQYDEMKVYTFLCVCIDLVAQFRAIFFSKYIYWNSDSCVCCEICDRLTTPHPYTQMWGKRGVCRTLSSLGTHISVEYLIILNISGKDEKLGRSETMWEWLRIMLRWIQFFMLCWVLSNIATCQIHTIHAQKYTFDKIYWEKKINTQHRLTSTTAQGSIR